MTKDEWSSFRRYLLFKTKSDSDNFEFFTFLQKRKGQLTLLDDSESIRLKYFPKFSQKAFLNLMSRLTLWLEEWISIQVMQGKNFAHDLYLIEYLNKKGLYDLANQHYRSLDKKLSKTKGLDTETHEAKWKLLHTQYYSDNPSKRSDKKDFFKSMITQFMQCQKERSMLYLTELINRSSIRGLNYAELKNALESSMSHLPSSELYGFLELLFKLVTEYDLESGNKIFSLLNKGFIKKPSELHTLLTMYLVSYSLKIWEKNILKDPKFIIDVYDYALEEKVLMQSGKIPVVRFHNIISTVGGLQAYNKTNAFIEKWYNSVETDHPDSTMALAKAQNAFYHGKYDLILEEIRNIDFENTVQKARALGLEIIAIYKDPILTHELLHSKVNNFQRFLQRNNKKLSNHYLQSHLNLTCLILQLYKRKHNKSLVIDISQYSPLIYRTWMAKEI